MRRRLFAMLAVLFLFLLSVSAQEIPAGVTSAFQKGSAEALTTYMGDKVSLTIQGNTTNADKQKATATMRGFFADNKVSGFVVNHDGKRDESSFLVGTLTTTRGKFRVNCFLRKAQQQYLIYQIRIDKVNE
ncbi:MAG: DUF4783 domain-containing protein [Mediterranea sp.]|jgi:hypothetical protein|nr:DUF4783 domain-containing protein [Mediterranea sp.]